MVSNWDHNSKSNLFESWFLIMDLFQKVAKSYGTFKTQWNTYLET